MILEIIAGTAVVAVGTPTTLGLTCGVNSGTLDNQLILNKKKTEIVKRTSINVNLPDLNDTNTPPAEHPINIITEIYSAPLTKAIPWIFGGYTQLSLRKRVITDLAEKLKEVENLQHASSTNNTISNELKDRRINWEGQYRTEQDRSAFNVPSNYNITFKPARNSLQISIKGPEEFVREIETYIKEANFTDRT